MKSFEECIDFIENTMGLELWESQKALLHKQYECKHYYYSPSRMQGLHILYQAMQILKEQMEKENHND